MCYLAQIGKAVSSEELSEDTLNEILRVFPNAWATLLSVLIEGA